MSPDEELRRLTRKAFFCLIALAVVLVVALAVVN
jgi:hypothetical protein